jgi:hypothetical protein
MTQERLQGTGEVALIVYILDLLRHLSLEIVGQIIQVSRIQKQFCACNTDDPQPRSPKWLHMQLHS